MRVLVILHADPAAAARAPERARAALAGTLGDDHPADAPPPVHVHAVDGGALAWTPTADAHAPFPLARRAANGNLLLVAGTPVSLDAPLDPLLDRAAAHDAAAAGSALSDLDGAFAALHWDAAARALTVVTDALGMQPLYLARLDDGVVLASDLKGLAASGLVPLDPDAGAWGAFHVFGHVLGDRTFLRAARRLPGGTVWRWPADPAAPSGREHWRWPEPAAAARPLGAVADDVADALARSAAAYGAYGHEGTVLLSGGYDSRLVLCTLLAQGRRPRALVVAHRDEHGDADGRYALRIARALGVPAEYALPEADVYAGAAYARYLARSESANPSLGLFIARVAPFVDRSLGAVWDGLAPQALRALGPHATRFADFLAKPRARLSTLRDRVWPQLWTDDWASAMAAEFGALLDGEAARYADDEFGVAQFSIRNRTRLRIANNPFQVFGAVVLPFTPGVTREYYGLVGSLAAGTKGSDALMRAVFERRYPEGLAVPFCSGAKLLPGAGRGDVRFRAERAAAALLKRERVRRGLERARVLRPFAYDVAGPLAAALRGPLGDATVVRPALREAGARGSLPQAAAEQLFYWAAVQRVLGAG